MGLLDIFKKRNSVSQKNRTPPPPPFDEEEFNRKFLGVEGKEPKQEMKSKTEESKEYFLRDFFNNDLTSIPSIYEGEPIKLDKTELGIFTEATAHMCKDGTYNVDLISKSTTISPELKEFIKSCVATFGPTKNGEGEYTKRDSLLLSAGLFSRMWDKLWIDMETDPETDKKVIVLTIFNVGTNINLKIIKAI